MEKQAENLIRQIRSTVSNDDLTALVSDPDFTVALGKLTGSWHETVKEAGRQQRSSFQNVLEAG